MNHMLKRRLICIILALIIPLTGYAGRTHEVFFKGTDHELDIYRIHGQEEGPTLMIMGGIQGNEPGGYLAADLYVDMGLKKGNLIVVPRANFYSILVNDRGPNGDMNRKFADAASVDPDSDVVKKIKDLMAEADYFLNMHDGSGFYHPDYIDNMHNPRRFGQSIITDSAVYTTPDGVVYDLEGMANRIIERVNTSIHDEEYRFRFNNHQTASMDSIHKEQRKSATYYMLTKLNRPAFASETSKSIKDFRKRVVFQTMVVNAFMKEVGIEPAQPSIYIDPPMLEYVLVSLNNASPIAVGENEHLFVNRGDTLKVTDIKANYTRGVIADIRGYGQINDTGKELTIENSTTVDVRKDMFPCGKIYVDIIPHANRTWLIIEINDVDYALKPDDVLNAPIGSVLVVRDLVYRGSTSHGLNVNFKGFVSNWDDNTGEDRGHPINTSALLSRYAQRIDDDTRRYRISAMQGETPVANFFVDLKVKN
ncbi:MAG TPA: M14/M99 family metallopeptidase [Deltaproteobacteria bacterium]|nr:M14/M99 family metallopeptidase [Deltaproteobacteria bacterium]